MEKMELEEFRGLVRQMITMGEDADRGVITEEEAMEKYTSFIRKLEQYDLSDIPFEEWDFSNISEGYMFVFYKIIGDIDFSKTNANLDFSKIAIFENDNDTNTSIILKNCNIKNFPFLSDVYSPDWFDEKFINENPAAFLSEDAPKDLREKYYSKSLSMEDVFNNLDWFEGKRIEFGIETWWTRNLLKNLGESFIEYARKYENLFKDIFENDSHEIMRESNLQDFYDVRDYYTQIPSEKQIENIKKVVKAHCKINGVKSIEMLKQVMEIIPFEEIPLKLETKEFINKYGLDKLEELDFDLSYLEDRNKKLTDIDTIDKLSKELEDFDLKSLLPLGSGRKFIDYSITDLKNFGIKDLTEITTPVFDMKHIQEMMERMPLGVIDLAYDRPINNAKKRFIEQYGIDYMVRLDEETNGIFSHNANLDNDNFLGLIALVNEKHSNRFNNENNEQLSYEQFKQRIADIIKLAKKKELQKGEWGTYDFIKGDFRKEHSDLFIDGDIEEFSNYEFLKENFYLGRLNAKQIQENPGFIPFIINKDLEGAFANEIAVPAARDVNSGNLLMHHTNMANFISEKYGSETFFRLCVEYGEFLDQPMFHALENETFEKFEENIQQTIYRWIVNQENPYSEKLPDSFKNKYPELFLSDKISDPLRSKFYTGNLSFKDIKENPDLLKELEAKNINVGISKMPVQKSTLSTLNYFNLDYLDLIGKFGDYLNVVNSYGMDIDTSTNVDLYIQNLISTEILLHRGGYGEDAPEYLKEQHPELFLAEDAPDLLKKYFYKRDSSNIPNSNYFGQNYNLNFKLLNSHPEWQEYLEGKNISLAFSEKYGGIFNSFDERNLKRMIKKNPEALDVMALNEKVDVLKKWYKSTNGQFIPHHTVMLQYPEDEIEDYLSNIKWWSQLMKSENYNSTDEGITAMLKASYALGVFEGDANGFNHVMELFNGIPTSLSLEDYSNVVEYIRWREASVQKSIHDEDNTSGLYEILTNAYGKPEDENHALKFNSQKEKQKASLVRGLLESANIPWMLTPQKAHQLFDSFEMKYDPEFAKFFWNNAAEILRDTENIKDISQIQKQFKEIYTTNAARGVTLEIARDYIKSVAYQDIDIGNELLSEQAKIVGYSQQDFEKIQELYNEGSTREFSSIPRIEGKLNGYTYEMLRCDDPLALTIGTLTDCCQEIGGAGHTSMEHSVLSKDGRVFCVRDEKGRIVAQSWFWRNQYTGCFDNIEIPHKIFTLYEKEHPDGGANNLAKEVLEVYKKAATELMEKDENVYKKLLNEGEITQEQFEALSLGKITIGLGYNDIADAIKDDATLKKEDDVVMVKNEEKFSHIYTDAHIQYTVAERDNIKKSGADSLYVYEDDIPVYDGENMKSSVLLTMKRMEIAQDKNSLSYLYDDKREDGVSNSQKIINQLARNYYLKPENTKVMANSKIAIVYSEDGDKLKIANMFSAPIKDGLSNEQKVKATEFIENQFVKALKQLNVDDKNVDTSDLDDDQVQLWNKVKQRVDEDKKKEKMKAVADKGGAKGSTKEERGE